MRYVVTEVCFTKVIDMKFLNLETWSNIFLGNNIKIENIIRTSVIIMAHIANLAGTLPLVVQNAITQLGTMTEDLDMGAFNITNTGTVTATTLAGTLSTAAQTNVTSLGAQVVDLAMGGNNITNTGTVTATTLAGTLSTAAQTNVTSLGVQAVDFDMGGNDITNTGTVTATTLAGTLSTAAQPNVSSLGAQAANLDMTRYDIINSGVVNATRVITVSSKLAGDSGYLSITSLRNENYGGGFARYRARESVITGAPEILQHNDYLAYDTLDGHDGVSYKTAYHEQVKVDGTPVTGIVRAKRLFYTANSIGTLTAFMSHSRDGTVKIGAATDAHSSSILELTSTSRGFLPPRMTQTQREDITGTAGLMVYDTTYKVPFMFHETWQNMLPYYGTWVGTMGDGTNNFTISGSSKFNFMRLGQQCNFNIVVIWSSKGSASGEIQITLPYTVDATLQAGHCSIAIGFAQNITFTDQLAARASNGGSVILLLHVVSAGGTDSGMEDTAFGATGVIYLSGSYATTDVI